MLSILSILLLCLLFFIIYGEIEKWRIQRKLKGFAIPRQWPILGVAWRFINKTNEQMIDMLNELVMEVDKTPIQVWFGPFLAVVVAEPEDMQVIFNSDDCLNRPFFYDHLRLGTSVSVASRELWKPQRHAFTSIFNYKMIQTYLPQLNVKSKELVEQFEGFIAEPGDLYRKIFIGKIDMIIQTTTGLDYHIQTTEIGGFLYRTIKQIMANMMYRITRIWLKWNFTYRLTQVYRNDQPLWHGAEQFLQQVIEEKVDNLTRLRCEGIDHLAMVQANGTINLLEKCLLLERDNGYSRMETIDQMHAILVGGVVSSTITIHTTLLMLAIHEEYQEAVVDELRSIFDTPDTDVTGEHLKKLVYLDRCIRESMRLFTPAPVIARQTTSDIQLTSGTIPTGTSVVLDLFHLHRNTKIWGADALEYRPDRFLAENVQNRPSFSFNPFAGGSRNCMCMKYAMASMKVTLVHLLRRYRFMSDVKMGDIRFKLSLVMDIINEKPLTLQRRAIFG